MKLFYNTIYLLQVKSNSELPQVLKTLIGKEFLFKIEKSADHGAKYDDSYKVKKVCADQNVIDLFKDADKVNTPQRVRFQMINCPWAVYLSA